MATPRVRPLVAVIYRIPLVVEAISAAFGDLADVQGIRAADGELAGLLAALRPDAVVVEHLDAPQIDVAVPLVHVNLQSRTVARWDAGEWCVEPVDLSGEAIRNVALSAMLVGSGA